MFRLYAPDGESQGSCPTLCKCVLSHRQPARQRAAQQLSLLCGSRLDRPAVDRRAERRLLAGHLARRLNQVAARQAPLSTTWPHGRASQTPPPQPRPFTPFQTRHVTKYGQISFHERFDYVGRTHKGHTVGVAATAQGLAVYTTDAAWITTCPCKEACPPVEPLCPTQRTNLSSQYNAPVVPKRSHSKRPHESFVGPHSLLGAAALMSEHHIFHLVFSAL